MADTWSRYRQLLEARRALEICERKEDILLQAAMERKNSTLEAEKQKLKAARAQHQKQMADVEKKVSVPSTGLSMYEALMEESVRSASVPSQPNHEMSGMRSSSSYSPRRGCRTRSPKIRGGATRMDSCDANGEFSGGGTNSHAGFYEKFSHQNRKPSSSNSGYEPRRNSYVGSSSSCDASAEYGAAYGGGSGGGFDSFAYSSSYENGNYEGVDFEKSNARSGYDADICEGRNSSGSLQFMPGSVRPNHAGSSRDCLPGSSREDPGFTENQIGNTGFNGGNAIFSIHEAGKDTGRGSISSKDSLCMGASRNKWKQHQNSPEFTGHEKPEGVSDEEGVNHSSGEHSTSENLNSVQHSGQHNISYSPLKKKVIPSNIRDMGIVRSCGKNL